MCHKISKKWTELKNFMKLELEINAYRRKETEAVEGTFVARKNIKKLNAKQTGFTAVEQNENI